MSTATTVQPTVTEVARPPYAPPAIVYELKLETRAGSPLGGGVLDRSAGPRSEQSAVDGGLPIKRADCDHSPLAVYRPLAGLVKRVALPVGQFQPG